MKQVLDQVRGCRALRVLGWLSLLAFPAFCALVLEYFNAGKLDRLIAFWRDFTGPACFGLLVMSVIFVTVLLLAGRAAVACAAVGGVSFLLAFINYMKASLNGDNFFPEDILMARQAGSLVSFLSGGLPKWMAPALAVLVLWCLALWLLDIRFRRGRGLQRFAAASLAALVLVFCAGEKRVNDLFQRYGILMERLSLQYTNYVENGFIGAFLLNLSNLEIDPPEGYSREMAESLLAAHEGAPAVSEEQFDVILVLSESFFDVRELPGLTLSRDPLTNFDALRERENCFSGKLYTNAIGGGTVRPEFEILTGLNTEALPGGATPYEYVKSPMESHVSNYKDAGYRTVAMHPYIANFYARDAAYPLLGFDRFMARPEIESRWAVDHKRGYVTDLSLEAAMEEVMEESGEPIFLFAITMQNHQPFNPLPEEEISIQVRSDQMSQANLDAVTTYVQGLYDADRMLGALADYVDSRERPTVLVFFGDHKPTLGGNFGAYDESGLFSAAGNYEFAQRSIMYSTPFLVYSNRELETGMLQPGKENELSSYFLMTAVAQATGFRMTPYMELLAELYETAPFYNDRLVMPTTPELEESVRARNYVTYYRLFDGEQD